MRHLITLICILVCGVQPAVSHAEQLIGARRPCPSPDGQTVAFDYQGDIWTVPMDGGYPRRITANDSYDFEPVFSPDGMWIAYHSDREGNGDIYIIPSLGGREKRITFHGAWDRIIGWSSDCSFLYFESVRHDYDATIFRISLDGGLPEPVIHDDAMEAAVDHTGERIVLSRGANPWWRKHFTGSGGGELWIKSLISDDWTRLTKSPEDERFPCWSSGGDSVFFVAEADSIPNLHCLELETGEISVVTGFESFGVRFPKSGATGTICFETARRLYSMSPPYSEPREIPIVRAGDCLGSTVRFVEQTTASGFTLPHDYDGLVVTVRGQLVGIPMTDDQVTLSPRTMVSGQLRTVDPAWSPSDESIVFASDRFGTWDIFSLAALPAEENILLADRWTEKRLTASEHADRQPAVSPDGEMVAFIRDQRQLCVMPVKGGTVTVLHSGPQMTNFSWSPDSRYIAFSKTTLEWREDVFIIPREGGCELQVTRHPNDDFQPLWDPKGRWLVFASRTEDGEYSLKRVFLTKNEFQKTREDLRIEEMRKQLKKKDSSDENNDTADVRISIEEEDIHRRVRTITSAEGYYYRYAMTPDGGILAFKGDTYDGYDLFTVDIWGDEKNRITTEGQDPAEFYWNHEGNRLFYRTNAGKIYSITKDGKDKKSVGFDVRLRIDTAAERRQMFDEGWRLLRDGFYDSSMHGIDWPAIHDQYVSLIDPCGTEAEFYNLLREMIGELGASHLGVWRNTQRPPGTGELGIVPDPLYRGDGVRILRVIDRSPAWMEQSRLRSGEIVTSIDGVSVISDESFYELLRGTAGKRILIGVDSNQGSRRVPITPVTTRALRGYLREEWIESNQSRADSLSGNRIGYLYIRAMGQNDWLRFQRDFMSHNFNKEALIIDVRNNSGGRIHNQILEMLTARAHSYRIERNGEKIYDPAIRWEKPLAVLINEGSYSDGEIFPWAVKTLGIGTLVGVPTNGSVIGTNDVQLLDGTTFRIPRTGWWTIHGINQENNPCPPDIYVERFPEEQIRGNDSQLEEALRLLMEKINQ